MDILYILEGDHRDITKLLKGLIGTLQQDGSPEHIVLRLSQIYFHHLRAEIKAVYTYLEDSAAGWPQLEEALVLSRANLIEAHGVLLPLLRREALKEPRTEHLLDAATQAERLLTRQFSFEESVLYPLVRLKRGELVAGFR